MKKTVIISIVVLLLVALIFIAFVPVKKVPKSKDNITGEIVFEKVPLLAYWSYDKEVIKDIYGYSTSDITADVYEGDITFR